MMIVAKEPMVRGTSPVWTRCALDEAAVRCCWFLNFWHPKILCSLRVSKVVQFSQAALVLLGCTGGIAVTSW